MSDVFVVVRAAAIQLLIALGTTTAKRYKNDRLARRLQEINTEKAKASPKKPKKGSAEATLLMALAKAVDAGKTVSVVLKEEEAEAEAEAEPEPEAEAEPEAEPEAEAEAEPEAGEGVEVGSYVFVDNPEEDDDPWNGHVTEINGENCEVQMADGQAWEEPVACCTVIAEPEEEPEKPKKKAKAKAPKPKKERRKTWYETAAGYLCGLDAKVTKDAAAKAVNDLSDKDNLRAAESAVTTTASILVVAGILESANGDIVPAK